MIEAMNAMDRAVLILGTIYLIVGAVMLISFMYQSRGIPWRWYEVVMIPLVLILLWPVVFLAGAWKR